MFDGYGKLMGLTESFYEEKLKRANPLIILERLLE